MVTPLIRIYFWADAGNCRKLKTDRLSGERKAPSRYLIYLAGFGRRFDSLQSSPIRYRGSRVYFGARYYRGVDFIVNIYEGGSLGFSHPRLPFHRRPRHYLHCRYQRSYYRLPPSPPLPIYSTLYALLSRHLRRFIGVFSKKNKYEKEINSKLKHQADDTLALHARSQSPGELKLERKKITVLDET